MMKLTQEMLDNGLTNIVHNMDGFKDHHKFKVML